MNTVYDLSGLSLPVGNHNIHVIAKAANYRDSNPSDTVVYTVHDIIISGLEEAYKVGTTVSGISATLEGVGTTVAYTINGDTTTSYVVTSDDIGSGVTVAASHNGVNKTASAEVISGITITGLEESYAVGTTVSGIAAVITDTTIDVPYTINGQEVTSWDVTSEDITDGITVEATYKSVTETDTATVTAE